MEEFPEFLPDKDSIEVPEYLPDTPAMREDLAKYYGSVQLADACAGSIIEVLREKGLLKNTLIISQVIKVNLITGQRLRPIYAGLHVPYIASGPGVE